MIKNLLNATKNYPYSPEGTFNLKYILDECLLLGANSTLWSRQKLFHHVCLSSYATDEVIPYKNVFYI